MNKRESIGESLSNINRLLIFGDVTLNSKSNVLCRVGNNSHQLRTYLKFLLLLVFALNAFNADAQVVFTSPSQSSRVKACDDYATDFLHDPWDMSSNSDVNNYVIGDIGGITDMSFSQGAFSFLTTTPFGSAFHLFSPQIIETTRVGGRWGQDLDFNGAKASKYRQFAMRMFTDTQDVGGGFRLVLNRSVDYVPNRTASTFLPIKTGWHTYRLDMTSFPISTADSSNTAPWLSGSITGFSILPTSKANARVWVDFVRLEDPTTCPSVTSTYVATSGTAGNLFNVYLDEDQDPFNGYSKKIVEAQSASGAGSTNFSFEGVGPGYPYNIVGLLHSDYAMLERDNPWDMSDSEDISLTGGISGATFSDGSFSGTASSSAPSLYVTIPTEKPINAAKYRYLSFRLNRSDPLNFAIFFNTSSGGSGSLLIDPTVYDLNGDKVYHIDMAQLQGWSGTIKELILRPVTTAGATFSLDFMTLRSDRFVTELDSGTKTVAAGVITVNSPPVVDVIRPRERGGEAFQAWNMNNGDFPISTNIRTDADPAYPGEKYTTWLPDVRTYEGVRGDMYKGTNRLGNDDPADYFTFPNTGDSSTIDASQYKNFVVKANIAHELDVCLGSIIKPLWLNEDETFTDTRVAIAIYNRWKSGRWYEYVFDLTKMVLISPTAQAWTGIKKGLRVDPHEFHRDTCGADGKPIGNETSTSYYFDYAFLTKDVTSTGLTTIVYQVVDPDDQATVNFYLSTNEDGSGGTLVASQRPEAEGVYVLDTSGVANGSYYLRAEVSDGLNTTNTVGKGRFIVANGSGLTSPLTAPPILSLASPTDGMVVCDALQLKGFSLLTDKLEWVPAVEVSIDGANRDVIEPSEYSPAAVLQYSPQSTMSSVSGFNRLIDVSSLTAGTHTVTVKAYSPDGTATTQQIAITKASQGCPSPLVDPDPSGSAIPQADSPAPDATPTPETPTNPSAPSFTAKHNKKGAFTMTVSSAGTSDCSVSISAGAKAKKLSPLLNLSGSSSGTVTLTVKKLAVDKKKVPSLFFQVSRTCSGSTQASASKKVKFATASGKLATPAKVMNALKKAVIAGK